MARSFSRYFEPKKEIPRRVYLTISASVGILILIFWSFLSYGGFVEGDFLPTPSAVLSALFTLVADGSLARNAWASFIEIMTGFILSSLIAVPLGVLVGSFRIVQAALEPIVNFFRYLPISALIPLLILWVGIGLEEKIAIIFLGTFFNQLIMVADASAAVPSDLLDVAYTLGANRRMVVSRVLVPATMPGIMDALRVSMGVAWTYVVIAELVASREGLGYLVLNASRGLYTDQIFVGILVLGTLGLIFDRLLRLAKERLLPWSSDV
ncbi:ABC transporter permease [Mesorhizobium sp. VK4C]|uniref:ABC transporter permease n=1 Tax=Mesorhizobium captivum TaxID=3072319 RepID=UPI002A24E1E4|nr:ABC transporter permease [Mesorhizobium sp. VK4C]MDX8501782.1 ABC transporter permease [Mesorhizobium sp. VK4C]